MERDVTRPMDGARFDHLGVAVADLDRARADYEALFGYQLLSGPFDDPAQEARVCFLGTGRPGEPVVELITPLGDTSHVARVLKKGLGAYHVCYEVAALDDVIAACRAAKCILVSPPTPAVAYGGRRIAWLYWPSRQLVELVER